MLKETTEPEGGGGGGDRRGAAAVEESCGGGSETSDCCAGCGGPLTERFYLLAAERRWHLGCLVCGECRLPLDTQLSCYYRHGSIYCKHDYYRLFSSRRCSRCGLGISSSELVMRARGEVFHLQCFTCSGCGVLLSKGDTFGLRDGLPFCSSHLDLSLFLGGEEDLESAAAAGGGGGGLSPGGHLSLQQTSVASSPAGWSSGRGRPRKRKLESPEPQDQPLALTHPSLEMLHSGDLSSSMESLSYDSSATSPGGGSLPCQTGSQSQQQRTKRMRTSFKHHQLRTMKSYFAINQNPDAKDLKQLAQKTGLSKRVLQVWFQNARAKWRRNLMRGEAGGGGGSGGGGGPVVSLEELHRHQALHFPDLYS